MRVEIIFNCACTPCFNIIETVFGDLKFHIRKKNLFTSDQIVEESRKFLENQVDVNFMNLQLKKSLKYFKKALLCEEF